METIKRNGKDHTLFVYVSPFRTYGITWSIILFTYLKLRVWRGIFWWMILSVDKMTI